MRKQKFLVLLVMVIIIVGAASLFPKYQEMRIQRAVAVEQVEYLHRLKTTVSDLRAESLLAEPLYKAELAAWQNTLNQLPVENRYFTDPTEAVSFVRHYYLKDGTLNRLVSEKERLDQFFQELAPPPEEEYQKEYAIAVQLHQDCNEYVSLALTPQGTIQSYQARFNDLQLKILKGVDEFSLPYNRRDAVKMR